MFPPEINRSPGLARGRDFLAGKSAARFLKMRAWERYFSPGELIARSVKMRAWGDVSAGNQPFAGPGTRERFSRREIGRSLRRDESVGEIFPAGKSAVRFLKMRAWGRYFPPGELIARFVEMRAWGDLSAGGSALLRRGAMGPGNQPPAGMESGRAGEGCRGQGASSRAMAAWTMMAHSMRFLNSRQPAS